MEKTSIDWKDIRAAMVRKKAARASKSDEYSPLFRVAALSSSFIPEELAKHLPDDKMEIEKLNTEIEKLRKASRVINDRGTMKWQLKDEERKHVLQSTGDLNDLKKYLPKSYLNKSDKEDETESTLQRMLNAYLRGTAPDIGAQSLEELGATYQLSGWFRDIKGINIKDKIAIEGQLRITELTAPFRKLTEHFKGREKELTQLRNYKEWPPLLIHGLGGAGKSTLISKFILEHLDDSSEGHIPFIYLDFDRPGVSVSEPLTLLFEGLRQLMLQFTKHQQVLAEYYHNWEEELTASEQSEFRGSSSVKGGTGSGEQRYYLRDFDTIWNEFLGLSDTPLMFVLDSFEEVQYRTTKAELESLFYFLHELSSMIPKLRVIISGRSELPDDFEVQRLFVGPFDDRAAEGYLNHKGIKDYELIRRIYEQIGGNPLSLTLAAAVILKEIEKGDFSHDWLLEKMEEDGVQEMLFRRNLEHIHKEEIRQLAFPGLIVRQISAEVIQHILAAPCDLDKVDEERSIQLFEELKKETFLVNIDEHNRFRFRPDLRKLLIDLVQKKYPKLTREIHDLAIVFYKKDPSPESKAEYVYHSLKRGDDPESLRDVVSNELKVFLESSLSELSPNNYLFLASVFGLEVPDEVRKKADFAFWEEKMVVELKNFLSTAQAISFPGMQKRLEERKERSSNSPLRLHEASFYELSADFSRAREISLVALKESEKYAQFDRQPLFFELLARLSARAHDYNKAQESTLLGIKICEEHDLVMQRIGMTIDYMQYARRVGVSTEITLKELLEYVADKDALLEECFQETYSMQEYIPEYNDPVPTLAYLKKHFVRFLPSEAWKEENYPGSVSSWLEKCIRVTMKDRWLSVRKFKEISESVRKTTEGNLEILEKFVREKLGVFLREIIPPSVYEVSLFDVIIYAEQEGQVDRLMEKERASRSAPDSIFNEDQDFITTAAGEVEEMSAPGSENMEDVKVQIYISYSPENQEMKKELEKHLSILKRSDVIIESSEEISSIENMAHGLKKKMDRSNFFLILVSRHYMESDFGKNELSYILQTTETTGAKIVPVILEPVKWEKTALGKWQGLPRDGAVSQYKDRDKAYNEIAVGVRRLLDRKLKY